MARLLSLNECEPCDGGGQVADVDPEGGFVYCRACGGSGEQWGEVAAGGPTTSAALTDSQLAARAWLRDAMHAARAAHNDRRNPR